MNSTQRRDLRLALINAGFTRTACTDDVSGVGDYAETFTHTDGDAVSIQWSPRHVPDGQNQWKTALDATLDRQEPRAPRPDDSSGSIDAETLRRVSDDLNTLTTQPVEDMDSDDANLTEHTEATRARSKALLDMIAAAPDLSEHVIIIAASNPDDEQDEKSN